VAERFGWERVAAATHEVYADLVARGRTGRFRLAVRRAAVSPRGTSS
jgi:hypothetical protein